MHFSLNLIEMPSSWVFENVVSRSAFIKLHVLERSHFFIFKSISSWDFAIFIANYVKYANSIM